MLILAVNVCVAQSMADGVVDPVVDLFGEAGVVCEPDISPPLISMSVSARLHLNVIVPGFTDQTNLRSLDKLMTFERFFC